jgi:hypothetical protein
MRELFMRSWLQIQQKYYSAGGTHHMTPKEKTAIHDPGPRSSPERESAAPSTHTYTEYIYYLSESRLRKINVVPPHWGRDPGEGWATLGNRSVTYFKLSYYY